MYEAKCNTSLGSKMRMAALSVFTKGSARHWIAERILTSPVGTREDVQECKEIYKNIVAGSK